MIPTQNLDKLGYNVSIHMSKPKEDRIVHIPPDLLEELLTDSELRMVKQRLMILRLLEEGHTIRSIAEQVGVGTDTVVRMVRKIEYNPKLRRIFERLSSSKVPSKWVFGHIRSEEEEH